MPQAATDIPEPRWPRLRCCSQKFHTEHAYRYLILMVSHHLAHVKLTILPQMEQQKLAHAFRYDRHRVSAAELRYQPPRSSKLAAIAVQYLPYLALRLSLSPRRYNKVPTS